MVTKNFLKSWHKKSGMKCKGCKEKAVARNGKYCRVCYEHVVYQERQKKASMPCCKCGEDMKVSLSKRTYYKNKGGPTCRSCRSKISSATMIETRKRESTKEKTERGRKANKNRKDPHKAVEKQWESIRKDKKKYKQICEKRTKDLTNMWKNMDDDERSRRVAALFSSHHKGRSKCNEKLKQAMIDNGLYDGFVSEEVFHGFIPYEINHDKKIIVELFGNVYHCNPKRFNDPTLFVKTIGRTVGEQWVRDKRRLACFYKHGYKTIIVWEEDFLNNPTKVIERIKKDVHGGEAY